MATADWVRRPLRLPCPQPGRRSLGLCVAQRRGAGSFRECCKLDGPTRAGVATHRREAAGRSPLPSVQCEGARGAGSYEREYGFVMLKCGNLMKFRYSAVCESLWSALYANLRTPKPPKNSCRDGGQSEARIFVRGPSASEFRITRGSTGVCGPPRSAAPTRRRRRMPIAPILASIRSALTALFHYRCAR
jgi:hypothetical protein